MTTPANDNDTHYQLRNNIMLTLEDAALALDALQSKNSRQIKFFNQLLSARLNAADAVATEETWDNTGGV